MYKEIVIPIALVGLAVAFLDPFMVHMPTTIVQILAILLVISGLLYSLLVWQEKAQDEREYFLRAYAGRVSFIVGVAVLVIGIVYQVFVTHEVDPFLVATLALMTIAKYLGHKYAAVKH